MGQARLTNTDYSRFWPDFLQKTKQQAETNKTFDANEDKPVIVSMNRTNSVRELEKLVQKNPVFRINDNYDEQIAELVISRNPQLYKANLTIKRNSIKDYLKKHYDGRPAWQKGTWVYYPWSYLVVHILEEDLFWEMRTTRNRDLITKTEQQKFRDIKIGAAGMSVGSSIPLALALQGGAQHVKLVDEAVVSGSNLNRILAGVDDIGRVKSLVTVRKLYEMNPYLKIIRFDSNLDSKNLADFFDKPWPIDLVVDEVDELPIKIQLRVEARKRKLPVLMATELGDDVMFDVERFDEEPSRPLFHGLAGNIEDLLEKPPTSQREWLKHATTIINTSNVPLRMQQSLLKVGTQIVAHPQLGSTAMVAGAIVSYAIRQLSLNQALKSGRTVISLEQHISKNRNLSYKYIHGKHTKMVKRALRSM